MLTVHADDTPACSFSVGFTREGKDTASNSNKLQMNLIHV